jgi:hypothetical protein
MEESSAKLVKQVSKTSDNVSCVKSVLHPHNKDAFVTLFGTYNGRFNYLM